MMYSICGRFIILFIVLFVFTVPGFGKVNANPKVIFETTMGNIVVELYPDKAPVSVENFITYVDSGFYDGTIFHRVIDNFMIQGGGFDKDLNRKETREPIVNEATNGLKNYRGTIAYARTNIINSATSQFFINVVDNHFLDNRDETQQGYGYAVFGKVVEGMDVVDKIKKVKTGIQGGMQDVPQKPVVIITAKVVAQDKK
jgi:cyclophilin family peptidyl-prolyl cis-trans isomerase